jgi:hypothetical protein
MRSKFLEYAVNGASDFVTRVDKAAASPNVFLRVRGLLNRKAGVVAQRDLGSIHRYASYPIRPNAFKVISGAVTNGGLIRITTSTAHGFSTNNIVHIDEVGGVTAANGIWAITEVAGEPTKFDLQGSTFAGTYTSGGIASVTPIAITDHHIFYDPITDTEYDIVVGVDSNSKTRLYVYDAANTGPSDWYELTRKIDCLINGTPSANATLCNIDTITENGVTYVPATNELQFWIAKNTTKSKVAAIFLSTATSIDCAFNGSSSASKIGSNGMGWENNDVLELYEFTGIYDGFNNTNGATPHTRFFPVEQGRKVNLYYGNSDTSPTLRTPLMIQRREAKDYFHYYTGGAWTSMVQDFCPVSTNWWAVDKGGGGLIPFFVERGSRSTPVIAASGTVTDNIEDSSGNVWMKISATVQDAADASIVNLNAEARFYVTLMYDDDTKESDPIYFLDAYAATAGTPSNGYWPAVTFIFYINFAKMNKRISGIRVYESANLSSESLGIEWLDEGSEYTLIHYDTATEKSGATIGITSNDGLVDGAVEWTFTADSSVELVSGLTVQCTLLIQKATLDAATSASAEALTFSLNHDVDIARSYLSPREATKGSRQQGAVTAVNDGQNTLRLSSYSDGGVIHEDDNFPDISIDLQNFRQKIALNGKGQILGIQNLDDMIYVIRDTEIEAYDLQSGLTYFFEEKCVSAKSIHRSSKGIVFAGPGGIKCIPAGGGRIITLNPLWDNFYDGSLLTDDNSASYVTSAYRSAIVAGYFEPLEESWFAIQCTIDTADGGGSEYLIFRYSWRTGKWAVRQLHIGSAIAPNLTVATSQLPPVKFQTKKDGTITIAYKYGLLKYPYGPATLRYEDDVQSTGRTSSRGIPMDFTLSMGGLANAIPNATPVGLKIDHTGTSVDGYGFVTVKYYRNGSANALETKRFRIDDPAIFREFERAGSMESLEVRVSLPSDDLDNFQDFEIGQMIVGYRANQIQGNR